MNPKSVSPSLEHLRMFAAVVEAGSFSAAARELGRSQPVLSYGIATLESHLGLTLFERGRRRPVLTRSGAAVLAYARRICLLSDELKASAASLTHGLEGVLNIAVDSFFPTAQLGAALQDLAAQYPSVAPNIGVCARDLVLKHVVDRSSVIGISAIDVAWPQGIEARDFGRIEIVAVAAPDHMLAQLREPIPTSVLRDSIQITNKPTGVEDEARDVAVNSTRPWHVDDLATQVMLLRLGIGWGYLPRHVAEGEFTAERLVQLFPATRSMGVQPYSLIFRADAPPGQAARFLAERLFYHIDAPSKKLI